MTDRDAVVRELHDEQCHWMPRCTLSICDLYPLLKRAFEAGQAHEKEAVVGWLRMKDEGLGWTFGPIAAAISRGAHHTKGEEP